MVIYRKYHEGLPVASNIIDFLPLVTSVTVALCPSYRRSVHATLKVAEEVQGARLRHLVVK